MVLEPEGLATALRAVCASPVVVAFDVETTGLVAGVDRLVEVAAVAFQGDNILEEYSCLVNPGIPMPATAARITGITDEILSEAPPAAAALPGFLRVLRQGTPLAHNAVFDVGFVCVALEEAGLPGPEGPVLDTRGLARSAFPGRSSYSLANLGRDLELETRHAHRALPDAHACRILFQACVQKLGTEAAGELARQSGAPLDFCCHAPRQPWTARTLQHAMVKGTAVDIRYRSRCGEIAERTITPRSFSNVGGSVTVVAFCGLRNETRTFFLDSIVEARRTG